MGTGTRRARSSGTRRSWSRSRRRRRPAASATPASTPLLVPADVRCRRLAGTGSGCCSTSAPSTTQRRCGSTARWRSRTKGATRRSRVDITDLLADDGAQTIVVRADDDPHDLAKPRGKQDWQLEPHSIWYPRTTGIWQTVWLERVPADLRSAACAGRRTWSAGRSASRRGSTGSAASGLRLARASCASATSVLADDTYTRGRRRGAPPDRAVRSRHRRLPQRAAVEPRSARR